MEHTSSASELHEVTVKRNDPQAPGKPTAFFLDCTCGWGVDYVSDSKHRAMKRALDHSKEAAA